MKPFHTQKKRSRDRLAAFLFLLPAIVLLALFVFWPMVNSIAMSFYDWNPLKGKTFTGLKNYIALFHDSLWWKSLEYGQIYSDQRSRYCYFCNSHVGACAAC